MKRVPAEVQPTQAKRLTLDQAFERQSHSQVKQNCAQEPDQKGIQLLSEQADSPEYHLLESQRKLGSKREKVFQIWLLVFAESIDSQRKAFHQL